MYGVSLGKKKKVNREVTHKKRKATKKRFPCEQKSWCRSNRSEASSRVKFLKFTHTRAWMERESKGSTTVSAATERGAAAETAGLSARAPPAGGLVEFSSFYDRRREVKEVVAVRRRRCLSADAGW